MARRFHRTNTYKGRRVVLRGKGGLDTDVAQLEAMLRADYNDIMKGHLEDLEDVADQIQADAGYLVPVDTGALEASIDVHVSRSYR